MKSKTLCFVAAATLVGISSAWASIPRAKHLVKVDHVGHLKLGDSIDSLPKISLEKHHAHFDKHVHFSFYMFSPNLPAKCMNMQCGTFAAKVLRHGGVLLGGASNDYSKDIGAGESNPLLVVTDSQDHVTAIYRDISRENVDEALALVK